MTRLDTELLDLPFPQAEREGRPETSDGGPDHPGCQMALLSYKTSLGTKLAFTFLVFAVSLAAAAALVYAIVKLIKDGTDLSAVVTGVSGLLASGGVVFLVKRMNEAGAAEQRALNKVRRFCGETIADKLG